MPTGRALATLVAAEVETAERPLRSKDRIVAAGLGEQALAALQARGFGVDRVTRGTTGIRVVRLRLPSGVSPEQARDTVRSLEPSATADLDHFYYTEGGHPDAVPGQTAMASLIGWQSPEVAGCGALPKIGLIDTGINIDHEALRGQSIELVRGESAGSDPSSAFHGTAVAALLVGRADSRTPGLLPGASLLAIDAFYRDGGTADRTDVTTLVAAMEELAERGVGVMNLSLSGPPNTVLEAAVKAAVARDIVLIAAAGNKGPGAAPSYPAAYPGVIAVTAVDRNLDLYRRATQGDYVDLAAPGVDVWTAASIRGGRPKTGTSFAVPFVTAAAAVLRAAHPDLDAASIETSLAGNARDLGDAGRDPAFGWGLVQAADLCTPIDREPTIQQADIDVPRTSEFIVPAGEN
ncbi:S8 family serine peptidase [Chthonobacter albigriseus]|uniref:S8 family serine peptidase n=1 Tax=Chthonobacter albigriseus TaxID=1683161 RepID=UPI0015EE8127|nr:S8 family serine peptidase [Chthonobacter albigriseus]